MDKQQHEYGVLVIPAQRSTVNRVNGQFLKGHVPFNKGKKWNEFMSKRGQKQSKKGWKNLELRPKTRPDNAGRCRKQVVAIVGNRFLVFSFIGAAAKWVDGCRENVRRCCQLNQSQRTVKGNKINTDHKYKGVRFYYETDDMWIDKIKKEESK